MAVSDILEHINKLVPGEIFASREMLKYAPRNRVDKTLCHLNKDKVIKRVGWGLYTPGDGTILPSAADIVRAKARAFNKVLVEINRTLARQLRKNLDPDAKCFFATNGSSTKFWTIQGPAQLIHVAPRKEALSDSDVGVDLRTLWLAGKAYIAEEDIERVSRAWTEEAFDECSARIKQLPQWLSTLFGMPDYRPGAAAFEFP